MGTRDAIEFHDSTVAGITPSENSIIVQFRPAYVHRSDGRPGFDAGSGFLQNLDLVLSEAVLKSTFTELPCDLGDGSLSVGNEVFDNLVPHPFDLRGKVRFSAINEHAERLDIQGTQAIVLPVGEARYLERYE